MWVLGSVGRVWNNYFYFFGIVFQAFRKLDDAAGKLMERLKINLVPVCIIFLIKA